MVRKKDKSQDQEEQSTACKSLGCRMTPVGRHVDRHGCSFYTDHRQDLKDFARSTGQLDVVYSETGRGDGKG